MVGFIFRYWSKNDYEMIPNYKEVDFGTVQQPIKLLTVGYEERRWFL